MARHEKAQVPMVPRFHTTVPGTLPDGRCGTATIPKIFPGKSPAGRSAIAIARSERRLRDGRWSEWSLRDRDRAVRETLRDGRWSEWSTGKRMVAVDVAIAHRGPRECRMVDGREGWGWLAASIDVPDAGRCGAVALLPIPGTDVLPQPKGFAIAHVRPMVSAGWRSAAAGRRRGRVAGRTPSLSDRDSSPQSRRRKTPIAPFGK